MQNTRLLHYSYNNFYYGTSAEELQLILSSAGLSVLDVVLIAYVCLDASQQGKYVFLDEFAKRCFTALPAAVPNAAHYKAASTIYFSVRRHLKDSSGVSAQEKTIPAFILQNYAFGTNKQSLAVAIQYV